MKPITKVTAMYADTCLPDYWGGHFLPHISVPVYNGMTLGELKAQLKSEISQDAVAGAYEVTERDGWYVAAREAIDALEAKDQTLGDGAVLFSDLPEQEDDDDDYVHVYVVLVVEQDDDED